MKNANALPISESLSILDDAMQALSGGEPLTLSELIQVHENSRSHLHALIQHFINTRHPGHELEQTIWHSVQAYLLQLDLTFAAGLQESGLPQTSDLLQQTLLQRLDYLSLLAQWYYLRYQPLTEFFWRELHAAYAMTEPVDAIAGPATASYLQVLMLDSVNRNNMTRPRIALVNSLLKLWSRDLTLTRDYDESSHLFLVDLQVPRGARRIRKQIVGSNCRYWHVDSVIAKLLTLRQQLENSELPPVFPANTMIVTARRLVEKLLSEWSRTRYQRERRSEQRQTVMKYAQVVHGILNVCQHVKNMGFADATLQPGSSSESPEESNWLIDNESKFGFGAFVYADFNRGLEPGYLLAMDYELNPDLAVVGIARSIEQRSAHKYSVGIEVLSHTPSYVRLQQLIETDDGSGMQSLAPFSALFLPENDERKQPATMVMPVLDYVAAGLYQLHTSQLEHIVQLDEVLEQQADWVRVTMSIASDITLS